MVKIAIKLQNLTCIFFFDNYKNSHNGPVWQITWSHPKNGVYLASCSYDGTVVIHKEVSRGNFELIYTFHENNLSINCIAFAPHELGLVLACGSADGSIYTLTLKSIIII